MQAYKMQEYHSFIMALPLTLDPQQFPFVYSRTQDIEK